MTGSRLKVVAVSHRLVLLVVCLAAGMLLSACSNWKQEIGIEPTSPDEFAVESRAPLTVPPDFNLRPPEPGAPRPQETSVASKAQGVVDNAGPGSPGQQASGTLHYTGQNLADPNAQVADQSLAAKLLQSGDTNDSAVLENRKTTALEGVY
jgi:Protein of unknown function (DUF3035)